jgi:hypothetical protein
LNFESVFDMKLLIAVAIFGFIAISIHAEEWADIDWSKVEGKFRSGRIVGGQEVVPVSHPYQACLLTLRATTTVCGGSLISQNRILTAATCIRDSISVEVILGAHQYTANEPTQQRRTVLPAQYRIHPRHMGITFFNVAVLIFLQPITFTSQVGLIPLAPADAPAFEGSQGTISEWGRTEDGGSSVDILRSTMNPIISNAECAAIFTSITDNNICQSTAGGRGPCGGKLLLKLKSFFHDSNKNLFATLQKMLVVL